MTYAACPCHSSRFNRLLLDVRHVSPESGVTHARSGIATSTFNGAVRASGLGPLKGRFVEEFRCSSSRRSSPGNGDRGWNGPGLLASCSATTSSPPVVRESPAHEAQSYIVEARTTDLAANAVLAAGGRRRFTAGHHRRGRGEAHRRAARARARRARHQADQRQHAGDHAGRGLRERQFRNRLVRQQRWHASLVRQLGRAERRQQSQRRLHHARLERSRRQTPDPHRPRRGHLPQGRDSEQLAFGHAELQVPAQQPRVRRIRVGAGQRQRRPHLDRTGPHFRPRQRQLIRRARATTSPRTAAATPRCASSRR